MKFEITAASFFEAIAEIGPAQFDVRRLESNLQILEIRSPVDGLLLTVTQLLRNSGEVENHYFTETLAEVTAQQFMTQLQGESFNVGLVDQD